MDTKYIFIMTMVIFISSCTTSLPNKSYIVFDNVGVNYAVQGQGGPVVVLESGFATPMEAWSEVCSEINKLTTSCALYYVKPVCHHPMY